MAYGMPVCRRMNSWWDSFVEAFSSTKTIILEDLHSDPVILYLKSQGEERAKRLENHGHSQTFYVIMHTEA
jgi:hypothetical protein